jgi:hypothetical protein
MTCNGPLVTERLRKHGRGALGAPTSDLVAANQRLAGVHGRS